MSLPDQNDAARRVRAALAYADLDQKGAMAALNVSRSTLGRLTGKKGEERKTIDWSDLWKVADVCKLPREWFSADLARLHEIVPPDMPTFRRSVAGGPPAPPDPLLQPVVDPKPKPGTGDGATPEEEAGSQ